MRPVQLSQCAVWCGARLVGEDLRVERVLSDSRAPAAGGLFVALRGERFDGHDFAAQALAHGAVALLVERELPLAAPQLVVADSLVALGRLAAGLAATRATRVLALTGSNGKTSVKTLTQSILARLAPTYANPGNRNNEIGLPLALLDQPEDAAFGIYEMGAGKPGDIAYLCGIAPPQIALVNNIGPAHLERMGSLLGIARTKGAIYEALPPGGTAVNNADDAFALLFERMASGRRLLRFGLEASAEIVAERIRPHAEGCAFDLACPAGRIAVQSPLPGRHNVLNALAAAGLALAAGASLAAIADGIAQAPGVPGRQQSHRLPGGATLIDDSYNANPGSVAAAIAALAARPGERILVLGEMRELGPEAAALHAEVGAKARAAGIQHLFTLGGLTAHAARAFGAGAHHFDDLPGLLAALATALTPDACLLVKGSRGAAMERVVQALLGASGAPESPHAA